MNHIETGIQTADVNASAAIPAPIGPASSAGLVFNGTTWVAAKLVNANVDAAAAIAYSKLNLAGGIVNNDVSASAAIAYSKLNLAAGIVNADLAAGAAIVYSKLNLTSSIVSADIVDGTLVNADVSASAAIAASKISGGVGMQQICTLTLGGAQASFDTNTILGGNIPSTYNHLRVVCMGRSDTAATTTSVGIRFNNDSAANYSAELATVTTGTGSDSQSAGTTSGYLGLITAASSGAGLAGQTVVDIASYAGSTFTKMWTAEAMERSQGRLDAIGGWWASTAAITRITVLPAAGNFVAGSQFTLYGWS